MKIDNVIICDNCHRKNPISAEKCANCGNPFVSMKPFHILHPEMDLKPYSEYNELTFFFKKPDYVEDPHSTDFDKYLYIVRNGKVGILHWKYKYRQFWGNKNDYLRVIPCIYDRIVKQIDENMFECHMGDEIIYRDLHGNVLK